MILAVLIPCAVFAVFHGCSGGAQQKKEPFDKAKEAAAVEKAVNNVFGWAVDKDFDLFFSTIADDTAFISVTPYERVKFGTEQVRSDTSFWTGVLEKRDGRWVVVQQHFSYPNCGKENSISG